MNFRVFDDLEALSTVAADDLVARAESRDRLSVVLSGGSTPRRLYQLLGSSPRRERLAARRILWIMGDERAVPPDHPESNARLVRETLFREGVPGGHTFAAFRTELGDPAAVAAAMERDLRRELGTAAVDLAILGAGTDGHTASLFSGTDALEEEQRWALAVHVPQLDAWRLTLSLPLLRGAAERWILATGSAKREVIAEVHRGTDLPVARVTAGEGETWWLVDREAWNPEGEER